MTWKKGPMPPGTYGFGGVVPIGGAGGGFYFADFQGDKVKAIGLKNVETGEEDAFLTGSQVAQYNNSLELPPQ